jgi:uncharacterized protein
MRFWDSSALVPLIVEQATSARTDSWFADDPVIVVWTLTPVEITSAIRRLVREGALPEKDANLAEARTDELARACHIIFNLEAVKSQARRLMRLHPLRAADALQLAAALEWAKGKPSGRTFITLDKQLALAATREGFMVLPD